jgi:thiamine pyrophosphate-dependent acetolactate synthase large subunit-like protein
LRSGRPDLDWLHLAKGTGVPATRVTSLSEFAKALREGFVSQGPTLIEVPAQVQTHRPMA